MTNNRLFLDIHAIQTLPPSNINRDDTGSPKTAQYGGVRRARVSSQAWKRAMRDYFYQHSAQANVGVRTLEIVDYLAKKILNKQESLSYEEAMEMAEGVINKANIKTKDQRARALFFLGDVQADQLAQAAIDKVSDKKVLQEILRDNPAIDIALFGRMVADDPSLNEDASSQVAHAISTHAVETEFDFYTAVDDLSPEDNAGAGMLGTIEFNSSTLYRYANVALHELVSQLDSRGSTINTAKLFVEAFVKSLPTGKVNTFANQTLPQAILVELREDRPINLVTAFERPVRSSEGYVDQSVRQLFAEAQKVQKIANPPVASMGLVLLDGELATGSSEELESLMELLSKLETQLETILPETGE